MIDGYMGSEGLMKRIQDPLGWPELNSVWEEEARKKNRISRRNLSLTPCGQLEEAFKAFNKVTKISPKYAVAMIFRFPHNITSLKLNSMSEDENEVGSTTIVELDRYGRRRRNQTANSTINK